MAQGKRHRADNPLFSGRLIVIAGIGAILLLPPLLSTFNHGDTVFGVPAIWVYLFLVWGLIIGLVAFAVRRSE